MEIEAIIRSRRKTLALIVKPDGSVVVRAPLRTPERLIRQFIEKNAGWVLKKQSELRAALPAAPRHYAPGESFDYLGSAYPLTIVTGQSTPLVLEEGFKLAKSAQAEARLVFEQWYRGQARRILMERVDFYACLHGFQYKRIGITSARTRWGSCSVDGSLNFSWRLILAPLEAVDYVVIHELVHTVCHNHSQRFWKRVEQIMPDYRERKQWLRKNGRQLVF